MKNVDLTPSSTFFLELELVELDVLVEKFMELVKWSCFCYSGVLPNTPYI
jgi:hypothetical protein